MQITLTRNLLKNISVESDKMVFGTKVGIIGKLFGCWHENLSRPFAQNSTAYRTCLECGARKHFNSDTLQTFGAFYYPPIVKEIK